MVADTNNLNTDEVNTIMWGAFESYLTDLYLEWIKSDQVKLHLAGMTLFSRYCKFFEYSEPLAKAWWEQRGYTLHYSPSGEPTVEKLNKLDKVGVPPWNADVNADADVNEDGV